MLGYHEIAEIIKSHIFSGKYPSGSTLPNQQTLADIFHVSRMTISRAIKVLKLEGLIETQRGVGSKVIQQITSSHPFDSYGDKYFGGTHQYSELGHFSSTIISFDIRLADDTEEKRFALSHGDKVYDIIRLRNINNHPIVLEYTVMPIDIIPGINEDILNQSIYQHIKHTLNLEIGSSYRRIQADKADQYDIIYLQCDQYDPILEVEQMVYLIDGRPFEYSQTRHVYNKGSIIMTNMSHH